ncbi:hypothetical protein MF672_041150 [Actinomadura sp. ATCC 31491]|uniref:Uncharacterized protein n=1 Tax=Actinomadura luzonensis TaxID=2805427 RepID=A0ABT0G6G5_9ACTN|nr:hypothetical protein [Actinomadura luzonensis]MCK2220162.1 hypothetical protein [Actinomadura luzonensis]
MTSGPRGPACGWPRPAWPWRSPAPRPATTTGDAGGAQVLDLAPAQGGFAELVFPGPGRYPVVDHAMRRAEAGAHGVFEVTAR